MGVYDNTRKMWLDDMSLCVLAKRQIGGEELSITKDDWQVAIEARAEKIYKDEPLSPQRKFAKAIGGMATAPRGFVINDGDPIAKSFYAAMKRAKRAPAPEPGAPVDAQDEMAKAAGPAAQRMLQLARTHNAANPKMSPEQSYAAVYTDRRNVGLKQEMEGDVEYQRRQNAAYTNPRKPPFAGSGGVSGSASKVEWGDRVPSPGWPAP